MLLKALRKLTKFFVLVRLHFLLGNGRVLLTPPGPIQAGKETVGAFDLNRLPEEELFDDSFFQNIKPGYRASGGPASERFGFHEDFQGLSAPVSNFLHSPKTSKSMTTAEFENKNKVGLCEKKTEEFVNINCKQNESLGRCAELKRKRPNSLPREDSSLNRSGSLLPGFERIPQNPVTQYAVHKRTLSNSSELADKQILAEIPQDEHKLHNLSKKFDDRRIQSNRNSVLNKSIFLKEIPSESEKHHKEEIEINPNKTDLKLAPQPVIFGTRYGDLKNPLFGVKNEVGGNISEKLKLEPWKFLMLHPAEKFDKNSNENTSLLDTLSFLETIKPRNSWEQVDKLSYFSSIRIFLSFQSYPPELLPGNNRLRSLYLVVSNIFDKIFSTDENLMLIEEIERILKLKISLNKYEFMDSRTENKLSQRRFWNRYAKIIEFGKTITKVVSVLAICSMNLLKDYLNTNQIEKKSNKVVKFMKKIWEDPEDLKTLSVKTYPWANKIYQISTFSKHLHEFYGDYQLCDYTVLFGNAWNIVEYWFDRNWKEEEMNCQFKPVSFHQTIVPLINRIIVFSNHELISKTIEKKKKK